MSSVVEYVDGVRASLLSLYPNPDDQIRAARVYDTALNGFLSTLAAAGMVTDAFSTNRILAQAQAFAMAGAIMTALRG